MTRYLLLLAFLAAVAGCGDNTPAEKAPAAPVLQCNPPPGWVDFVDDVCPGYVDIGVCHYKYSDGRDITAGDCWNPTVNRCVWTCQELAP